MATKGSSKQKTQSGRAGGGMKPPPDGSLGRASNRLDLSREFPPGAKADLKTLAGPEDGLTILGEAPVPPKKPKPPRTVTETEVLRNGTHARRQARVTLYIVFGILIAGLLASVLMILIPEFNLQDQGVKLLDRLLAAALGLLGGKAISQPR